MPTTSFTLGVQPFPVGTTVGVYARQTLMGPAGPVGGVILTSAVTGADSETTFTGLEFGTDYWAAALVGDGWRSVAFRTEPDPVDTLVTMADIRVLQESLPSVEYPEFAALVVGDDWTAAFEAARDYVGVGGAFRAENGIYELDAFTMLAQQRLEGQGPARTILKAAPSAVRVIDMPGVLRHSKLKGVRIDGRSRASEGTRLQALNGTGGNTSQDASFEDVEWWQCAVGQRVAGTGAVPQAGQADKTRYNGCTMYQCSVGLQVDAINAQEQVWHSGEISDPIGGAMIAVLLNGGGFTGISMQFQSTILGTGKIMAFGGANVHQVLLFDVLTEGWLTGLDSGASNFWPLQGVTFVNSTMQLEESGGGDLVTIDRGGSVAGLIAIHTAFNGGPIRLRGADTYFDDQHCTYNTTGGTAATVITSGANSKHTSKRGTYVTKASAGSVAAPAGAELISITGTTQINTITGGWDGRRITLSFVASVTVGSGTGNIALAGAANFGATAADTLTLMWEGAVWREVARSVN